MNCEQLVQDILEGQVDPLMGYAELKRELTRLQKCIKEIEPLAFDEAAKFQNKSFDYNGYHFTQTDGRRIWDFKGIPSWKIAKEQLTHIENNAKAAYSAFEKGLQTVDGDGELIELPVVSYSKPSISVK